MSQISRPILDEVTQCLFDTTTNCRQSGTGILITGTHISRKGLRKGLPLS